MVLHATNTTQGTCVYTATSSLLLPFQVFTHAQAFPSLSQSNTMAVCFSFCVGLVGWQEGSGQRSRAWEGQLNQVRLQPSLSFSSTEPPAQRKEGSTSVCVWLSHCKNAACMAGPYMGQAAEKIVAERERREVVGNLPGTLGQEERRVPACPLTQGMHGTMFVSAQSLQVPPISHQTQNVSSSCPTRNHRDRRGVQNGWRGMEEQAKERHTQHRS